MIKLKNNLFVILIFLINSSCQEKAKNDTPENFARGIFNALKNESFESLQPFVVTKSDTSNFIRESIVKEIKSVIEAESKGEDASSFWNSSEISFDALLKDGRKQGINWSEIVFKGITYDLRSNYYKDFYTYFTFKGKEYRFGIFGAEDSKVGIKDFRVQRLINIKDEIERLENEDNYPFGLQIHYENYSYKYNLSNTKIINNFEFEILNNSDVEIDYVKYYIILETELNLYKKRNIVFRKTYELKQKIYPNDIIRIKVTDIVDLNTGVDASVFRNVFLNGDIIDARPHPKFER